MSATVADRLAQTLAGPVVRHETHGAWVLLSGDRALKVRKPVRLAFLDYSTVERRFAASLEEVRLNEALAPGLYRGVRALVETPGGGLETGPWGWSQDAVDYAVEMERFDERTTMAALCEAGRLTAERIDAVGARIAAFHAGAQPADDGRGGAEAFAARLRADLDELADLAGGVDVPSLRRFAEGALRRLGPELDRRAARGLRRYGHGDLRAEHVVFGAQLRIVDALEFDEGLRCTDVASDLAFLLMDLEAHDARWAAERLVAAYERAGGDAGDRRLRALLGWQRAVVRIKVALLRDDADGARALVELADRLAWRARAPAVLLVAGPPASGKSTLAAELGRRTELPVIATDPVRKAMHGVSETERLGAEAYEEAATRAVYEAVGRRAARAVAERDGAVVDATARSRALRAILLESLGGASPVVAVRCAAAGHVLRERARRRLADPARVSDADPEVAVRLARRFEAIEAGEGFDIVLAVRTDGGAGDPLGEVAAALDGAATGSAGA